MLTGFRKLDERIKRRKWNWVAHTLRRPDGQHCQTLSKRSTQDGCERSFVQEAGMEWREMKALWQSTGSDGGFSLMPYAHPRSCAGWRKCRLSLKNTHIAIDFIGKLTDVLALVRSEQNWSFQQVTKIMNECQCYMDETLKDKSPSSIWRGTLRLR